MYWGYIIFSKSKDRFYVGTTGVGVEIRIERHNRGWSRSAKAGIPWELKYTRSFDSKFEALKWEKSIKMKKSRVFIERLISLEENEI